MGIFPHLGQARSFSLDRGKISIVPFPRSSMVILDLPFLPVWETYMPYPAVLVVEQMVELEGEQREGLEALPLHLLLN